ncbi:MAG TPA: hypothetical protein VM253_07235 [Candidatus Limnocylindrales bacterium]|nr:hypothetical protein [Candidatus Limnocylindrales bacterium]
MPRVFRHAGQWMALIVAAAIVLVALDVRPSPDEPAASAPVDDAPASTTVAEPTDATAQVAIAPMHGLIEPIARPAGDPAAERSTRAADPTPTPAPLGPLGAGVGVGTGAGAAATGRGVGGGPTPIPVADPNPATYTTSEVSGSFGQALTLEGYTVMLRRSTTPPDSQCLPGFAGDAFEMTIQYTTWFDTPTFEYNAQQLGSCIEPSLPIVPGTVYTVLLLERTNAVTVWISPHQGSHSLAFRFR